MRKEFNMMLTVVVCAILGIICVALVNVLYTQGIIIDEMIGGTLSIADLGFIIFFLWLLIGIIIGVMKD